MLALGWRLPSPLEKEWESKGSRALGKPPQQSSVQAIEAMRLNADDFVP